MSHYNAKFRQEFDGFVEYAPGVQCTVNDGTWNVDNYLVQRIEAWQSAVVPFGRLLYVF